MKPSPALLLAAAAASGMLGCALQPPPESAPVERVYTGTLVDVAPFEADFIARQEVRGRYGDTGIRFSSVLQKRGGTLTLLGLTPIGTRAFALEQTGEEVTFTPYGDRTLPFPPRYILIDIHRCLFIGIGSKPLADGEHVGRRFGEEITELWEDGKLQARWFRPETGETAGAVKVEYLGWTAFGVPAAEVRLSNEWFGYQLTITTTSYQRLGQPAD